VKKYILASLIGLLIFLPANGSSQDIAREKLIEDIDTYVKYICQVHADPWRLITEADFKQKAEEIRQRIRKSNEDAIMIFDCFFYLEELAAAIQDGHTGINPPFQQFKGAEPAFPFALKVIEDKVFVVEKWGDDPLPLYSQILEVDQVAIEAYRAKSNKLANTSLEQARDFMFGETFSILLGIYFKQNPPWEIKYKLNNQVQTVEVQGMSVGEYMPLAMQSNTQYREYLIEADGKTIPVLDIPSFSYGEREDYDTFIDEFFKKHKKAEYLVIDLRENPGGSGYWGYYLLDYLVDAPYLITKDFTFKVSDTMRKSGYADKAGELIHKAKNGEYLTVQKDAMQTPHKNSGRFKGQVFCLISERTFSAGVVTAAIFQGNKMGILVGQETRGRVKFCSDPVNMTLPNTKLEAQIPLAIYALPGDNPDRGVMPDIKVTRKIDDYLKGRDKEIEAVKKSIRKQGFNDK
jgi:hypothetical protein